jgi:hypothetical protein
MRRFSASSAEDICPLWALYSGAGNDRSLMAGYYGMYLRGDIFLWDCLPTPVKEWAINRPVADKPPTSY